MASQSSHKASSEEPPPRSRRERQLVGRVINVWTHSQMENNEELRKEDQDDAVFVQLAQRKVFRIEGADEKTLRQFIYDKDMTGCKDKELLAELYEALGLGDHEVGRQDSVITKIGNAARIPREFIHMLKCDDVDDVASRMCKFLNVFAQRDGAKEALQKLGIILADQ